MDCLCNNYIIMSFLGFEVTVFLTNISPDNYCHNSTILKAGTYVHCQCYMQQCYKLKQLLIGACTDLGVQCIVNHLSIYIYNYV